MRRDGVNAMERRYDVLAMGRSLIDLYARETGVPFASVSTFAAYVGGCPANISVGARRLGLRTGLLTAVGDDLVGDFVLEFLRREDVDVRFAPRKAGRRTSAVLLALESPERSSLVAYRDNCADLELTIDDVGAAPIDASRALLITGTGLTREPSLGATLFAAERARAAGTRVVLDLDYRADYWPGVQTYGEAISRALPFVDVAIGTTEEVRAALFSVNPDAARPHASAPAGRELAAIDGLLAGGPEALVMKRGAESTLVYLRGGACVEAAAFRVDVCNLLGAGDAFASGFLYGWLKGWDWPRAARMGNACGAMVVTRHGCANFMPREQEVFDFIAAHGGF